MTQELASKLMLKLRVGVAAEGAVGPEFFDEIKILHSRSSDFFPNEFNELMNKASFTHESYANFQLFVRLVNIVEVIESLPEELRKPKTTMRDEALSLTPVFELNKSDKNRIFELCADMRTIVYNSEAFDQPHRLRLLNRIAAIEAETHKPKGVFDVILGGVSDVGETGGKFGKDIKPLVDRIKEIAGIARKGTKDYDQLPAPDEVKQLPPPSDDEMV